MRADTIAPRVPGLRGPEAGVGLAVTVLRFWECYDAANWWGGLGLLFLLALEWVFSVEPFVKVNYVFG